MRLRRLSLICFGAGLVPLGAITLFGTSTPVVRGEESPLVSPGRPSRSSKTIQFTNLKADETVLIDVRERGCFHQAHIRYVFAPSPAPYLQVTKISPNSLTPLPPVMLTAKQVTDMDDLLRFYRKYNNKYFSTTERKIHIAVLRSAKKTRSEFYIDSTGTMLEYVHNEDLMRMGFKSRPAFSLGVAMGCALQSQKKHLPTASYQNPSYARPKNWTASVYKS